ncbi:MAG: methionine aminopeptidase type [Bacteroidetes bacterium]|jgi:methionyl aminopeptidase|nr:methionine aminopeptidase type [Bacteroidota bacterium]
MIYLKTREEIEIMRESALMVSRTLGLIAKEVKPGVKPIYLDKLAEEYIRDNGGVPAFKGYKSHNGAPDFPATLCISINEAVVHGIPTDKPLNEGDIISVDCGVKKNGFFGDHAYTFAVGEIKPEVRQLLDVTKESLYKGIEQMVSGNRVGDISYAIQQHVKKQGYGIVEDLVGHGLGRNLHEDPQIPNYGRRSDGPKLSEGMVFAIEPMINMGKKGIKLLKDGWTFVTVDGMPSAHFEHDVAIVNGKPEILSSYAYIEEALALNK